MDPELLEQLRKQDWNGLGRALVRYAYWKAGVAAWREGADRTLALGSSAEDIAAAVITKVFAGDRTWDPTRGDLLPTLKRMVDSELDHLWRRPARLCERAEPEDPRAQEDQERRALETDVTALPIDPELAIANAEDRATPSVRVAALFESVANEPELQMVVEAIMDGCDPKPRHLAEHLKVPVNDINNRLRRLRRKVTK